MYGQVKLICDRDLVTFQDEFQVTTRQPVFYCECELWPLSRSLVYPFVDNDEDAAQSTNGKEKHGLGESLLRTQQNSKKIMSAMKRIVTQN